MISSFAPHNLIPKILIPIQFCSLFKSRASSFSFLILLLLLFIIFPQFQFHSSSSSSSHSSESIDTNNNEKKLKNLKIKQMKIHPLPKKRNNATIQYAAIQNRQQPFPSGVGGGGSGGGGGGTYQKKLRRLPHIFSRVLELPFRSDADVSIQESPDCFKFVVETDGMRDVRAHAIQIHPGVTKIVVRVNGSSSSSSSSSPRVSPLSELELDMWRFRLPESTLPELASAAYEDGVLTVTVPKGAEEGGGDGNGNGNRQFRGGMENNNNNNNRLVLVQ